MNMNINVIKRNGKIEPLDLTKFHKVVAFCCEDITGVSASEIEIASQIQFYDGIKTSAIQETLIKAAAECITVDTPNYQYVASRLINYNLRKEVYGQHEPIKLYTHIYNVIETGYYDHEILSYYTTEEWEQIEKMIDHRRDFTIPYAGMEQFRAKYLIQNRVTKQFYETPQMAYILIASILFKNYPKETRLKWVKDYYDAISTFIISIPSPIIAALRGPDRQFSSCVLIDCGDDLDSIIASNGAIMKYISQKAGIGINGGRIRSKGSNIRGGKVLHTGVVPFYKTFEASVKSSHQGGIRSGSATLNCVLWHKEIEDILVLKNNKGTAEQRVRNIDYVIQFNRLMYERLISNGNITLFSPNDVPGMYEAYFSDYDKFKSLYEEAEKNTKIQKKTVPAIDLFSSFMRERKETGRIYLMNVDHVNDHGSFNDSSPVYMTNLCVSGDTIINILKENGDVEYIEIKDLHDYMLEPVFDENGKFILTQKISVMGHNLKTGKDSFKQITAFAKTGYNRKVMKIIDDQMLTSVTCTPEHKIYTKNRGYVQAKNLKETDILHNFYDDVSKLEYQSRLIIQHLDELIDVYDITVEDINNFYANNILVHNCVEICTPTSPMRYNDPNSEIALCTLSAINFGKIKQPSDFKNACDLAVRALDELLDYQGYPIKEAEIPAKKRRSLGVGIINFAYWLAKNDLTYSNITQEGLDKIHEYMEAFSYYLIKAGADLAVEKGACEWSDKTKYSQGIVPIDTYKKEVDELVRPIYKLPWNELREQLKKTGTRNSTFMAFMPAESSALTSNSTNGIEPVRALITSKKNGTDIVKQVVPELRKLKNKYDLLWDQKSPEGYLKICAVFQKFLDQAISVNTTYNPKYYENEEIPMSVMLSDLLMCYRNGIKNLYYFNTNDGAGEQEMKPELESETVDNEEICESCAI